MDTKRIEQLVHEILKELGEDLGREGLAHTPARVARAFEDLFRGYGQNPQDFVREFASENYDEMIICKDIDFFSTCEHHMMPFFGKAHIGYIPDKTILGISKLPRIVDMFARRLQNQERLTMQVGNTLNELLKPRGVGVVIEARHLCMMARGVEKQNTVMTTSSFTGCFRNQDKTRNEFLRLIR